MGAVVFWHVEVDGAFAYVGIACIDDFLDVGYLFDDVARSVGLDAGRKDSETCHGRMVAVEVVLHDFHRLELFEPGLFGYFVFAGVGVVFQMSHVGDVADVAYFVAYMRQVAVEYVECMAGRAWPRWPSP